MNFWGSTALYIVGTGVLKLIPILMVPLITRRLSPDEVGVIELTLAYILLAQIIATLSMEAATGRFFYNDPQIPDHRRVVVNALVAVGGSSALLGTVLILASGLMSTLLFGTPDHAGVVALAGGIVIFSAVFNLLVAVLRFLSEIRLFFILSMTFSATAFGGIMICIFVLDLGVIGYFTGQLLAYCFATVTILAILTRQGVLAARPDRDALAVLLKYALPILPGVVTVWLNIHGTRALSMTWLSLQEIGLLSVAMRLASVIKLGEEGLKMIWSPYLFRSLAEPGHQQDIRTKFTVISTLTMAVGTILLLTGHEIYVLLLPPEYASGFPIFCLMLVNFCLSAMIQLVLIGPVITKRTWINTAVLCVGSLVSLALLFVLLPLIGLFAPVLAMLTGTITILVTAWVVTEQLYPIGFSVGKFCISLASLGLALLFAIYATEAPWTRWLVALGALSMTALQISLHKAPR